MLDIKFVRDNIEAVRENIARRGMKQADPDLAVRLYGERNEKLQRLETLRGERNETAQKMKGKLEQEERQKLIERGRELKEEIAALEGDVDILSGDLDRALRAIPNMSSPDAPTGGEEDARELSKHGEIRSFDFGPKDHLELGASLDLLDFERATTVTGSKFYYLKNEGALLELALVQFALRRIMEKGYTPHITPDLARAEILDAVGFNPRGEETQVYNVEGSDLCLIGTAEITLGGMLRDTILRKEDLPIRLGGFSHCFRTEAGSHGAFAKGLYRVHQFSKVEMFAFCAPEESERIHQEMLEIEIGIFTDLGLPFRVIDTATGDLGAPAYRKFDIEAWMPSRGDYGEVTSTSNCTDYQSRRLAIRYRDEENQTRFVHTLNGTAVAVPRAILAILENYQQEDGSVVIPEALRGYIGMEKIEAKGK